MLRLSLAKKSILALLATFSLFHRASAQDKFIEFGQVRHDEMKLKECSFDKSADAMILLDHAVAYFNDENNLITERRIRLKILKEKGVERGDIRIPFYSEGDFENIYNIEAVVFTPTADGDFEQKTLERKNIFTRQVNKLYSLVTFALPNVQVGSIIDYRYRSQMRSYGGLRSWEFQSDIPVVTSFYELSPLKNSEFSYKVYKMPQFPIQIIPNKEAGKIRFIMQNVPGLRDEVYTTTPRSFLQRVNFQFASYTNFIGKTNYTNTWQKLSQEMLDQRSFGSQAGKDLSSAPFLKDLSPTLSKLEKLKQVFDFVRANIVWNHVYTPFSEDGVKTTLEKKNGNSGDINLLLVSLLRSAGVEAYPVLVSDRDHGIVDTLYSYLGQFNKVVAYATVDGRQYTLDGTDTRTPFFLVPPSLVNTTGFLVDKKRSGFVYFNNLPQKQQERILISGIVNGNGRMDAKAEVAEFEYAKLAKENKFRNEKTRFLDDLIKPHSFIKVDSFDIRGLESDSAALQQDISFHCNLKKSGGFYLLNYNLFTGFNENPFITQYRFTDIDFGTKYSCTLIGNFALPDGFSAEALPANKMLVSPDKTLSVIRQMQLFGNMLSVKAVIEIKRELYEADEYNDVKLFFREMVELLNEPVLLKEK